MKAVSMGLWEKVIRYSAALEEVLGDSDVLNHHGATKNCLVNRYTKDFVLVDTNNFNLGLFKDEDMRMAKLLGRNHFDIYPNMIGNGLADKLRTNLDVNGNIALFEYALPESDIFKRGGYSHPYYVRLESGDIGVITTSAVAKKKQEYKIEQLTNDLHKTAQEYELICDAFGIVLQKYNSERHLTEEKIKKTLHLMIKPIINKLKKTGLNEEQSVYIDTLMNSIKMLCPHTSEELSLRETQIAKLVTEGKSTKEISDILCLSDKTVNCHRANIRKKINIKGNHANLRLKLLEYFK